MSQKKWSMLIKKGGVHLPGQYVFYNLRTTCAALIKLCLSKEKLVTNIFIKAPLA